MTTHVENVGPIVKFMTTILKMSLCDYSDAYILVIDREILKTI